MSIEIKVPHLPESVTRRHPVAGTSSRRGRVARDETLVDLETDKVVLEVPAPGDGVIEEISDQAPTAHRHRRRRARESIRRGRRCRRGRGRRPAAEPRRRRKRWPQAKSAARAATSQDQPGGAPAARRTRPRRRMRHRHRQERSHPKADVLAPFLKADPAQAPAERRRPVPARRLDARDRRSRRRRSVLRRGARAARVPMTRLRARIAERLVEAQQTAAMLTTFNEVDMQPRSWSCASATRTSSRRPTARLGFMSFFVKAAVQALKRYPAVNASIDGNDIVYHDYHDIGVAVSSDRGLVVPVLRDAEAMSLRRDRKGHRRLRRPRRATASSTLEEMTGGTFTISNGGVFGSLLSTPILNPPQVRHPRHARDQAAPGGDQRRSGDPADDVPRALLRPPHHRRPGAVTFLKSICQWSKRKFIENPAHSPAAQPRD